MGNLFIHFGPDWATCHDCHVLIENKDCDGMVKRVAHAYPRLEAFIPTEFEAFLHATNGPPIFMSEALCGTN
jgi:hypothetical protein